MIFALDQQDNVLYTFASEQRAAEFCQHAGAHRSWRIWDETGRALIPIGFAPAAPLGLFALQGVMEHVHAAVIEQDHGNVIAPFSDAPLLPGAGF